MTRRICAHFGPLEIWLFGSAAKISTFDEDSDLDLLIVLGTSEEAARAWKLSHHVRKGFPRPLDLVFVGAEEFLEKKDVGGVCWIAFHEGEKIYDSKARAPVFVHT